LKSKLKVSFTELLYNLMELLWIAPEFVVKSTDIKTYKSGIYKSIARLWRRYKLLDKAVA
jgi:hypothetical protein